MYIETEADPAGTQRRMIEQQDLDSAAYGEDR
jgi:hypothetical protein